MAKLELTERYLRSVTLWNRLEGRPRTENFDRALRAEVRDALWMLSKQWQMGELMGDDAASPVLAQAHIETTRLNEYQSGDASTQPFDESKPLEAVVEAQPIVFFQKKRRVSLDIRLLMGRQWLKGVAPLASGLRDAYIGRYGVDRPDPTLARDAELCAHGPAWQQFAAVAGRAMDGHRLYEYLKKDPGNKAYDDIPEVNTQALRDAIDVLTGKWLAWFEKLFYQPAENASWRPDYLEYQFACSAPRDGQRQTLVADEYHHGHLDWYNLDVDPAPSNGEAATPTTEVAITRRFVPTSASFGGMPHPRWWSFEDWNTNLSFVKPDTTDLNKLLLLDFFLLYANDWFVLPVTLEVGTLSRLRGLAVTNVFGERTLVQAAGRGQDQDWQRWSMFTHAVLGEDDVPADMTFAILPVARKVHEGKPLEEVLLLRDEVANMVWGTEARIPLATGRGYSGKEAAEELRATMVRLTLGSAGESEAPAPTAPIRFQLVNSVPEHWIPFVPVHVDDAMREIQLQRASLPRIIEGAAGVPAKVEPRTPLLRYGLDLDGPKAYFLHEEEVSRAGVRVTKSFQRTRWYDGRVVTWVGIRKRVGRGGGHSELAFDQLVPTQGG